MQKGSGICVLTAYIKRYEKCAARLTDMTPLAIEPKQLKKKFGRLNCRFAYPEIEPSLRLSGMKNEVLLKTLRAVIGTLDPTLADVSLSKDLRNSFILRRKGTEIIIQDGKLLNREVLSSGTAGGVDIAIFLAAIISSSNGFYYCDEHKHTAIADKLNGGVVDLTAGVHTGINVFLGSSLNGQRSLNVLNAILREREYSIAHRARSCAATEIVDLEPLPDSTAGFRRYRTTADHKAPCVQGPAVLHVDTASLRQTQQTIVPGHIARGATCCRFVAAAYPRVFFAIFVRVTPGRCPTGRVVEI